MRLIPSDVPTPPAAPPCAGPRRTAAVTVALATTMAIAALAAARPVLAYGQAGAAVASTGAGDGVVPIGQVQGRRNAAPATASTATVAIAGRVSAVLPTAGGFYLQDDGDGDPQTSDGIFVQGDTAGRVVGEALRVSGPVAETGMGAAAPASARPGGAGRTTLVASRIDVLPRDALPALTPVLLRVPPADWEALEGMWVRVDAPLTVTGLDQLQRHGEISTSFGGRAWQPSERERPGTPAHAALAASNARQALVLEDGRGAGGGPGPALATGAGYVRVGSTVSRAEGVVDQREGTYRLRLATPPRWKVAPRPPAPKVAGQLTVAGFNMENYFNGDGHGSGFPTPRGAASPAQLQVQMGRLLATMRGMDPDVAALMEVENDGYGPDSSLAQFVDALNADGSDWRFITPPGATTRGPGNDEIRVALVYRASRATPVGHAAVLEAGSLGNGSRVPLAQAFTAPGGSSVPLVVVANHWKSKGCSKAAGADSDAGQGAGCWNALRTDSARRIDAWVRTDPTGTGSDATLLIGDFNAYAKEDPVRLLVDAGWADAMKVARVDSPYSYVYAGRSGRLDQALLSPGAAKRLRGAAEWHANADEAPNEDDTTGAAAVAPAANIATAKVETAATGGAAAAVPGVPMALPAAAAEVVAQPPAGLPWRSSDHDPQLLGFD